MFEIKRNIIETDLPVIVSNYKVLLFDEMPILFAGTNLYGNRILASIIDEDFTNKVTRFLYSIVDEKNYINFISGKITYLEILNIVKNKFFVDETFAGDIFVFPISYDDIPIKYLPSEDSFCPEAENELSLNFGVSLKGKKADVHKAEIIDINNVQTRIENVLKSALSSLSDLNLYPKTYLEPARVGSFRINFDIEFDADTQQSLFVHDKTKISTYLTKYLEYILVNLPTEEQNALKGISPNLIEVKNILQELYDESHTQIASNALDEILLDNINETAIKFEDLNTQINNTNSFSTIELINYGSDEVEHQIGLVDKDYFDKIRNKLSFVNEMVEKTILEDKTPQKYRILIYSLSTDTGNGKAKLFHGMTEEFDRVFIHIISNEKEIKGSIYTNGLHEGKVIDVIGIATKIDSNYKSLKIEL